MINLVKAREEFEKYVNNYNSQNPKIKMRIEHSYRVAQVSKRIAETINLKGEDVQLAELIGILHDIGRFEQISIYDTFMDKESIDHADFGVEVLFKDNLIRRFIKDDNYDEIIYKAIKNHNKYKIEEGLNEKELLQAKIIRDADKTDIYEVYMIDIAENKNVSFNYDIIPNLEINEEIIKTLLDCKPVDRNCTINEADKYVATFGFIFDYNFKEGLKIVKERKYIERLIKRIKNNNNEHILEEIQNNIEKFIDKRLNEQ